MREIRFRAWDIDAKQMEYIKDLYWFEENYVHEIKNGIADGSRGDYVIEQFTGLKDNAGNDIYEGDIIEFREWGSSITNTMEVRWDEVEGCWDLGGGGTHFSDRQWRTVVGNIHEGVKEA